MYMEDYIKTYDKVLDNAACNAIIEKFEDAHESHLTVHEEKDDERISFEQITLDEENPISKAFIKLMEEYLVHYKLDSRLEEFQMPEEYGYEAVRIKRYLKNDYDRFDPHVDVNNHHTSRRFLAFFLYLNTVSRGGETEFTALHKRGTYTKYLVKAEMGKMVVFPPMFPWPHAGLKPISDKKYLLHSYFHYV